MQLYFCKNVTDMEGRNVLKIFTKLKYKLCMLLMKGHLEIAKLLLENGANVHAKDNRGWTPIHKAGENGHMEVAKWLIENGVNVNSENDCDCD